VLLIFVINVLLGEEAAVTEVAFEIRMAVLMLGLVIRVLFDEEVALDGTSESRTIGSTSGGLRGPAARMR
jgi:hypothetical protein